MIIHVEFEKGDYLNLNAGGLFSDTESARKAFLDKIKSAEAGFISVNDHQGKPKLLNVGNINSIEFDYVRQKRQ